MAAPVPKHCGTRGAGASPRRRQGGGAAHIVLRAVAVDHLRHRREGVLDRRAVRVERLEPLRQRLLGVVLALREPGDDRLGLRRRLGRRLLALVVGVDLRRVELEVVDLPRLGVGAAAGDALDEDVLRHVEDDALVGEEEEAVHLLRLRRRPREPIQEPAALLAVGLRESRLDEVDHDRVGDEHALRHALLRRLAVLVVGVLHRRAEHVPRRDVHRPERLDQLLGDRAFARRRRAAEHGVDGRRLHGAELALVQRVGGVVARLDHAAHPHRRRRRLLRLLLRERLRGGRGERG